MFCLPEHVDMNIICFEGICSSRFDNSGLRLLPDQRDR